uniref:Protein YIPF n=1 Tax=Trichuris muris TaxID=70415 RepID=A0A5S6QI09_TRIMR
MQVPSLGKTTSDDVSVFSVYDSLCALSSRNTDVLMFWMAVIEVHVAVELNFSTCNSVALRRLPMSGFSDQSGWYGGNAEWTSYEIPSEALNVESPNYYAGGPPPPSVNAQDRSPYGNFSAYSSPSVQCASESLEDEAPLLEELGINLEHIGQKTLSVLNPFKMADPSVVNDCDLAGPFVFALLFGSTLLLHGKLQFGYIYGVGVIGCVGLFILLNLMTQCGISFILTVSIVGYCLLPMVLLSAVAAILTLKRLMGFLFAAAAVLWCSTSASKLFVTALSMDGQRFLVAYPCCLLYGVFALLAIF